MNDSLFKAQQFQKSAGRYASPSLEIRVTDKYKKMELRSAENGISDRDSSRPKCGQLPTAYPEYATNGDTSCPR
jgi:hypothetical protein